ERAADDELEHEVRHLVGGVVGGRQAVGADRAGERELLAEPGHPGGDGDHRDEDRGPGDPLPEPPRGGAHGVAASAGAGAASPAGRRPPMSIRLSAGWAAITLVKLTFSEAAVSATTVPSAASRPVRPSRAAAASPTSAPSALAPASPSMARSPRSSGSSATAAPSGAAVSAAAAAPPASPRAAFASEAASSGAPVSSPTLIARPGRRS